MIAHLLIHLLKGNAQTYSLESFGVCCIFLRGGVVIVLLFFGEGFEVHIKHIHEPRTEDIGIYF